jgi:hypothetical protein
MWEITFLVVTDLGELVGYSVGTIYLSAVVSEVGWIDIH